MTHHDRRTFLRALGLGTTGALASAYATGSVAAATTITVKGGGEDIWNAADEFHYYYAEVDGDFDVTVRVDSLEDTDDWAKAGLMVRQTLNADAETAMIRKTPGHETSFQWRSDDGQDTVSTTSGGTGEAETSGGTMQATYQRLVRSGDTIEAYGSTDGSDWTLIADISPGEIDLAGSAYVGLAVCSHSAGTLCTAQFSELSGLSPSSNQDVGAVDVSGSVSTSSGGGDTDPVVSTGSASSVGTSSATLSGSLDDLGGASSADAAFEYRESGASSWSSTGTQTLSATGSYSDSVSGLASGTGYEFRATVTASDGDADTGSTNSFSTSSGGGDTDPVVATGTASNVGSSSATLSGSLDDLGGASSADAAFEYRESGSSSWTATPSETLSSTGSFSRSVSGLASGTDYEFRATVTASDGDADTGSTASFSTSSGGGSSGGSAVHYEDGFADASWFDDSVTVHRVTEATVSAVESAFTASGPRLVVFEASGVIDLGGSDVSITNDRCWVAGQTAPSPGITFINGMVQVEGNDCVVQHIRVMRGETGGAAEGSDPLNNADGTQNVIFDHCTSYWGQDENLSVGYNSSDTTLANCLVAEGLEGPEENSNGTLVGDGATNVAILGTVYAKNNDRNPRHKDDTDVALGNNLVYYFDKASRMSPGSRASVVGNKYVGRFDWSDAVVFGDGSAYFEDNSVVDPGLNGRAFQNVSTELSSRPLWPSGYTAMPASDVESHNLDYAGARPADRISHETRVIDEIRNRSLDTSVSDPGDSAIPNSEADVGGYPSYSGSTRSLSVPSSGLRDWLEQWALSVEEEGASPP